MKILYVTQYFIPEICATTNRALANARVFSQKGHDVTVLTEMPNHPKGIIFPEYRKKIFVKETLENFKIRRVWVFTSRKKNFITRILFYTSFMFSGCLFTLFNWKKYDLIYATSPPLFVGVIGLFLKKLFPKIKFVFEVRDVWPDVAVEIGELKNEKFIKLSNSIANKIYSTADRIICVTKSFKKRLERKGVPEDKISVYYNGSDLEFKKIGQKQELVEKYQLKDKFVVLYAGNLGLAQKIETILMAAEILKNENVVFLLIGSGPKENELKNLAKEKKLQNVLFLGEIQKDKMNRYFSLADCGIIPLKNSNIFKETIPSKIFDYMSAELPIILGVKGEAKEILEKSRAGIFYEPDNFRELAEKIILLKNNKKMLEKMSSKGREFVEKNFNRNKIAEEIETELRKIIDN